METVFSSGEHRFPGPDVSALRERGRLESYLVTLPPSVRQEDERSEVGSSPEREQQGAPLSPSPVGGLMICAWACARMLTTARDRGRPLVSACSALH